nr:reverse transcriptase domain-containing protein [Tanacetum cinerariifolium]
MRTNPLPRLGEGIYTPKEGPAMWACSKQPFILEEFLVDEMADQRTMVELLRAPTEGYAEAIVCLAADGNTFPELKDNIQGCVASATVNYNQAVILMKLPKKLGDLGKFLILCVFSELKCKALANLGASINLMPFSVWKKLGLPELISTRMTFKLANRAICTPTGIARDVLVLVGKFPFPPDFVIVDYESDPRVPFILRRPFLRISRALIYVHESINLINVFNHSSEDFLENLFSTNHQSGNPTFSSHLELTSPEVKDDVFDPEGGNVLHKKLLDLDSTKDLHPPHHVSTTSSSSQNQLLEEFVDELALITFPPGNNDLSFDIESNIKEIEYLLHHYPIKDMDFILKDSIDQSNLADLNDNLANAMPEMFTDEHSLDYSSPPLYDEYDDDLFE